jgi:hypothetical protein
MRKSEVVLDEREKRRNCEKNRPRIRPDEDEEGEQQDLALGAERVRG